MMEPIISVKNISKKYNITHQQGGYIAMRDVLTDIAKRPFNFLKYKAKKIAGKETKEEFWALKDISFEIQKGEAVGIIGANGAGKSTLLKILSKITPPTTGTIEYKGTISSLLEVGTGFHPELTGRENIFLNGAILGMTKKEIAEKFDSIIKFAEIEKFLDTPVKRYSSGMYVRLAFAIAAHMEPDILVVDEVLAVGDAEFQKKCLGKMDEVTKTAGRTILFVSHNISAVQKLCKRCILLEGGKIKMIGDTQDVVAEYTSFNKQNEWSVKTPKRKTGVGGITIKKVWITDEKKTKTNKITSF
ncbi:MAG TPA: ABC transporter ATP-binding protein, partial [Candidatus Kaiserbacteria bacterium]|nr:ABC transporter ATP-binding protein [Candidatus Kaiserbacteria bacterium]